MSFQTFIAMCGHAEADTFLMMLPCGHDAPTAQQHVHAKQSAPGAGGVARRAANGLTRTAALRVPNALGKTVQWRPVIEPLVATTD